MTVRRTAAVAAMGVMLISGLAAPATASPETALRADDMPLGEHTEPMDVGDFTVQATEESAVTVAEDDRTSAQGQEFAQRLQLNGAGNVDARSLRFEAEAGEAVTVYAQSGSGEEDRALGLYDESWELIEQVPAYRGDAGSALPAQTFTIDDPGNYWIASPSSGVNIYYAELGEAADGEVLPWDEVQAPTITETRVDESEPEKIQVEYTGLLGEEGADLARAVLVDAEGEQVDEQIEVSPSESGTIGLTPQASGDHEITVQLERYAEEVPLLSDPVEYDGFLMPLAAPDITSHLTSAVSGSEGTVAVQWTEVSEAQHYSVALMDEETGEFVVVVDELEETIAELQEMTVGQLYQAQVRAHRTVEGGDEEISASETVEFTVAAEEQRWDIAHAGVGSGGEVTDHGDGGLGFNLLGNNSKIADSEDGFWYYYTQMDPETENFTMTATFEVEDSQGKDNQSGFGIIAIDDFTPNEPASRYFNSAGTMVAKYLVGAEGEEGTRYGTPGGKFVHGYTGASTESSSQRDLSDSRAFDWEYNSEHEVGSNTNPPRFEDGSVYTLTLRRSNTGFHSIWHREDGEDREVIHYDPDVVLAQNSEHYYLGVAVARNIAVNVTDISFTTVHPDEDTPAEDAPVQEIAPRLNSDFTSTTPHQEIDIPATANVHGQVSVVDAAGQTVSEGLSVAPGEYVHLPLSGLEEGENTFALRLDIDQEQPQLAENQELSSYESIEQSFTVNVASYGESGDSVWVSPEGSAAGSGTLTDPLDVHTAIAYAQPGQQIVLAEGVYSLDEALRIERGNSGTEDAPITLMSEPGSRVTFDLSDSEGGGIILRGDWWHLYNMEITNGQAYQKPMLVQGHHNVIERLETHHNEDTGLQISGHADEPNTMWPSHNTVLSSVAHNNADPLSNDADGFAAKLTVGEGNVFRYAISYHNVDDGFDLYAKSTEGPIGAVTIEDSVAFNNGRLEDDPAAQRSADGQGFKLGGESMPGEHLLRNAVSFNNRGNGVTSNSGPNVRVHDVTSVFNGHVDPSRPGANLSLSTNANWTDYQVAGLLSFTGGGTDSIDFREQSDALLHDPSNYINGALSEQAQSQVEDDRPFEVDEDWFVSSDFESLRPEIAEDGSVDMKGLFELTDNAPLDTGARLSANPEPTEIELLSPVSPGQGDEEEAPGEEEPSTQPSGTGEDEASQDEDHEEPAGGVGDRDVDDAAVESAQSTAVDRDSTGVASGSSDDRDPEAMTSGTSDRDGLALTGAGLEWKLAVILILLGLGIVAIGAARRRAAHR